MINGFKRTKISLRNCCFYLSQAASSSSVTSSIAQIDWTDKNSVRINNFLIYTSFTYPNLPIIPETKKLTSGKAINHPSGHEHHAHFSIVILLPDEWASNYLILL